MQRTSFPIRRTSALAAGALLATALPGHASATSSAAPIRSWFAHHVASAHAIPAAMSGATAAPVAPRVSTNLVSDSAVAYAYVSSTGVSGISIRTIFDAATFAVRTGSSTVDYIDPVLSPDGTKIAYARAVGAGQHQVVVAAVATDSAEVVLDPSGTEQCAPDWKTDTQVLYTEDCAGTAPSLQLAPAGGGASSTVVSNAGLGRYGAGAAVGSLVYVDNASGEITVSQADGSSPQSTGVIGTDPEMSDSGARIVFDYLKSSATGASGIAVMSIGGNNRVNLAATTSTSLDAVAPSWSEDGANVYYSVARVDPTTGDLTGAYDMWVADAGTGAYIDYLSATTTFSEVPVRYFRHTAPRQHGTQSTFTPVTPTRLLDTRLGSAVSKCTERAIGTPVPAGGNCTIALTGGSSPIPASAGCNPGTTACTNAVVLNLTGVTPTGTTFLSVYPNGGTRPTVSNLNLIASRNAAVEVQVRLGSGDKIVIYNALGSVHLLIDVAGYFATVPSVASAGTYHALSPVRLLDTRASGAPCARLVAGQSSQTCALNVTTSPSTVPSSAVAVVLNLTGVGPTASGSFLTAYPGGGTRPTASNLNLYAGINRANLVTVRVGAGNVVNIYNSLGSADVLVDLAGWYDNDGSGASFYPSPSPLRVLDTRVGLRTPLATRAPLGAGGTKDVLATGIIATRSGAIYLPKVVAALAFNVTGVTPTSGTFLSVYPKGTVFSGGAPTISNVNLPRGQTVPNLAIVQVPETSAPVDFLTAYNSAGSTPVIVDVFGYYRDPTP